MLYVLCPVPSEPKSDKKSIQTLIDSTQIQDEKQPNSSASTPGPPLRNIERRQMHSETEVHSYLDGADLVGIASHPIQAALSHHLIG